MTLKASAAMIVNWPSVAPGITKGDDSVKPLRDLFDDTRAYVVAKKNDQIKTDVKKEAVARVIDREIPMLVQADSVERIESAVAFSVEQNVRLIIFGGYDAPLCAPLLTKHDIPVIVSAVYRLPARSSDDYDSSYTLPNRLRELGIRYCISGSDSSRDSNSRNLPYHAGTAVAFGLPKVEALKSITLYPAQIYGVADRVGSLTVGKDATLIVTTGDRTGLDPRPRGRSFEPTRQAVRKIQREIPPTSTSGSRAEVSRRDQSTHEIWPCGFFLSP